MCEALCTRGWLYTGDEPADGPSETSGYRQARQESGFHGNVPTAVVRLGKIVL